MPALQRTFDNFWANARGPGGVGVQTRYAAAWRHVAARFRAQRGVMGYDLMNEPFPGSGVRDCFSAAGCREFERGSPPSSPSGCCGRSEAPTARPGAWL